MFQFKELIKEGKESASLVEQNHESITAVFSSLNQALEEASEGKVTLECNPNGTDNQYAPWLQAAVAAAAAQLRNQPTISIEDTVSKGTLDITLDEREHAPIAHYEQHPDGYPFTVEFLGERIDCWDQRALVEVLGKIVSSGQFWLKVKELESR